MEFRAQTYLGVLQSLAVIAGTLIVSATVKGVEDMLDQTEVAELAIPRAVGGYGGFLLLVPFLWVVLTIRAEKSSSRSAGFSLISGIALLLAWAACSEGRLSMWRRCSTGGDQRRGIP